MASPTRRTHLGRRRLLPAAVLALTAALAATGCTAPASPAGQGATAADGTAPVITAARARQVFTSYVTTSARAGQAGDEKLALSLTTGVQWATVTAAKKIGDYFTSGSSSGTAAYRSTPQVTPADYTYGRPTFYLPAQAGYPHFFVADVTRTVKGTHSGATTKLGGVTVPVNGTVLMLFEQASASAPWRLASTSSVLGGARPPRLAANAAGAIPAIALGATTLLASPDATGPLQAAVVDDGPASPAGRAVAAGPLTTGMYAAARRHALGLRPPGGDVYQWELEGSNEAKFALRTADGGALVFYAMYLNATVGVPSYFNGANPIKPGPLIRYPQDLAPWIKATTLAPRVRVEKQDFLSFAAIDPPKGSGKIQVIAIGGTLNYAAAS